MKYIRANNLKKIKLMIGYCKKIFLHIYVYYNLIYFLLYFKLIPYFKKTVIHSFYKNNNSSSKKWNNKFEIIKVLLWKYNYENKNNNSNKYEHQIYLLNVYDVTEYFKNLWKSINYNIIKTHHIQDFINKNNFHSNNSIIEINFAHDNYPGYRILYTNNFLYPPYTKDEINFKIKEIGKFFFHNYLFLLFFFLITYFFFYNNYKDIEEAFLIFENRKKVYKIDVYEDIYSLRGGKEIFYKDNTLISLDFLICLKWLILKYLYKTKIKNLNLNEFEIKLEINWTNKNKNLIKF